MKNYIQQLVELFGNNDYSAGRERKFNDGWLTKSMLTKKMKHSVCFGNRQGNGEFPMECNNQYAKCNRI